MQQINGSKFIAPAAVAAPSWRPPPPGMQAALPASRHCHDMFRALLLLLLLLGAACGRSLEGSLQALAAAVGEQAEALVTLQGSIPVDEEGREVRREVGCRRRRRQAGALVAAPPCTSERGSVQAAGSNVLVLH